MDGQKPLPIGLPQLLEGETAAESVLHVLDLSLVRDHEDEVVPELSEPLVRPLVLEDFFHERREPIRVGIDGKGVVMKQDQVGSTISHNVVNLIGSGREGFQVERAPRGSE